jgi:hypothetical protein
LDFEGWGANDMHLLLFLRLCGDLNVVLLSGDVHYSYTSTAKFSNFDDDLFRYAARLFPNRNLPKQMSGGSPTYQFLHASTYIQLNSSAARNFANSALQWASTISDQYSFFISQGKMNKGTYTNGELKLILAPITSVNPNPQPIVVKLSDYKPSCALFQKYNDRNRHNSNYIGEHNIGYVSIDKKTIKNFFLKDNARHFSERSWDFANDIYWQ